MSHPVTVRTVGDVFAAFVSGFVSGVSGTAFVAANPTTPVEALPFLVTAFAAAIVFIYALLSPP